MHCHGTNQGSPGLANVTHYGDQFLIVLISLTAKQKPSFHVNAKFLTVLSDERLGKSSQLEKTYSDPFAAKLLLKDDLPLKVAVGTGGSDTLVIHFLNGENDFFGEFAVGIQSRDFSRLELVAIGRPTPMSHEFSIIGGHVDANMAAIHFVHDKDNNTILQIKLNSALHFWVVGAKLKKRSRFSAAGQTKTRTQHSNERSYIPAILLSVGQARPKKASSMLRR